MSSNQLSEAASAWRHEYPTISDTVAMCLAVLEMNGAPEYHPSMDRMFRAVVGDENREDSSDDENEDVESDDGGYDSGSERGGPPNTRSDNAGSESDDDNDDESDNDEEPSTTPTHAETTAFARALAHLHIDCPTGPSPLRPATFNETVEDFLYDRDTGEHLMTWLYKNPTVQNINLWKLFCDAYLQRCQELTDWNERMVTPFNGWYIRDGEGGYMKESVNVVTCEEAWEFIRAIDEWVDEMREREVRGEDDGYVESDF